MKRFKSKNYPSLSDAISAWETVSRHVNKISPFYSFGGYDKKTGFKERNLTFMVENTNEVEKIAEALELQEVEFIKYYRG